MTTFLEKKIYFENKLTSNNSLALMQAKKSFGLVLSEDGVFIFYPLITLSVSPIGMNKLADIIEE
jgi:hypothetical protein